MTFWGIKHGLPVQDLKGEYVLGGGYITSLLVLILFILIFKVQCGFLGFLFVSFKSGEEADFTVSKALWSNQNSIAIWGVARIESFKSYRISFKDTEIFTILHKFTHLGIRPHAFTISGFSP